MSRRTSLALLPFLVLPFASSAASSQVDLPSEEIMEFSVDLSPSYILVATVARPPYPANAEIEFSITDTSGDRPTGSGTYSPEEHYFKVTAFFADEAAEKDGWSLSTPSVSSGAFFAGESVVSDKLVIMHTAAISLDQVEGVLNVTMERRQPNPPLEITRSYYWIVRLAPEPVASISLLRDLAPSTVRPNKYVEVPVLITNLDHYAASYFVRAKLLPDDGVNPDEIALVGTGSYYLQPKESKVVAIGLQTPRAKWWYTGSQLQMFIDVAETNGRGGIQSTMHVMVLEGFYISENLVLVITAFLVQIGFVVLAIWWFVHWRALNVYGKPLPPWKLPEERAHLARLKNENPRAHYVLRYYLMEEEHRSALLWYYAFKSVSKRQLKAETKALALRERAAELEAPDLAAFDRRTARLQRKHAHRIERLREQTEGRIARLQERLDLSYQKDYEKDHEKWKERVRRMEWKVNRPHRQALRVWQRDRTRTLAEWEKPFRTEKKAYEKALAQAKERYAKIVKKKDRPTWRAWREQMEDWDVDVRLSKKEGKPTPVEPELVSSAIPREGFPEPLKLPPAPELPPEPARGAVEGLPPEPRLEKPSLESSHYASKLRRIHRRQARLTRRFEGELAIALEVLGRRRKRAEQQAALQREGYLEASTVARQGRIVDRLLGRTPEAQELKHRRAFVRGQTKERIEDLVDSENASVERARLEGRRREADLELQIVRARAELGKAQQLGGGTPAESGELDRLEEELKNAVAEDRARLARARQEAKQRIQAGILELRRRENVQLAHLEEASSRSKGVVEESTKA